jgi:hypothetical protein
MGGLTLGPIYEYLSTIVHHYRVQEFETPNRAMMTVDDYPYSVFGIMIGLEGRTALPLLGLVIYIGVFAR